MRAIEQRSRCSYTLCHVFIFQFFSFRQLSLDDRSIRRSWQFVIGENRMPYDFTAVCLGSSSRRVRGAPLETRDAQGDTRYRELARTQLAPVSRFIAGSPLAIRYSHTRTRRLLLFERRARFLSSRAIRGSGETLQRCLSDAFSLLTLPSL